ERTGPPPLSFGQERLWLLERLGQGGAAYNMAEALRLRGALDVAAMERALGEIVRRHQSLRTTIAEADGHPVQVIAPFAGFTLPVEDLSGLGDEERQAETRRITREEAVWPFDLATGPLFRARLLRLGGEEHVLLLSMHHVAADGWSLGILYRELAALYDAFREGRPSPLPELAVQYADYARWQREQLQGEALERQLAWWRERLAGAPELLELPTDRPRPAVQTTAGAAEGVRIPAELLERLQALGRREGATLYMVLLGAVQLLLSRWSGAADVVVGTTIAGRTRVETEPLIGLFMNTLALRTDLSGDPAFRELLRRVRDVTLGAYEHQEVPFEKVVGEVSPERSLSYSPLFQVLFELHEGVGEGARSLPGLEVRRGGAELRNAKYDLSVVLSVTADGIGGGITYSTDLFDRATARRFVEHLARVLEQVTADPSVRLSRVELLGDEERRQVTEEWNDNAAAFPADRCIHQLFEAQAARTPEAVAMMFGDEAITFAELDARANRIANHLVGLGVGPEVRVGLCLERGMDLLPAILGVMKAGGAYVPMDPAHPAERLAYMLEDAAVTVLLTQESVR
ncbi:MAG TPA: condensation domain-containing protein, partial [Longimicrobiaceae bacterium]